MYLFLYFSILQYTNRTKGLDGLHERLTDQLTEVEKQLVTSQEVIEIRGKVRLP